MLKFEDKHEEIARELEKRRYRWQLKAIPYLDWDDIAQDITLHLYKKWHMWDQSRDFLPWVNSIISNQIINKLRNLYMNIARPCVQCSAREEDTKCRIYGEQCAACPLFKKWQKSRKAAFDVRMPLSIEKRQQEVYEMPEQSLDVEEKTELLHELMKDELTVQQYKAYTLMFIEGKSEEETAVLLGYSSSDKNRAQGYRTTFGIRKLIIEKAKKLIAREIY